MNGRALPPKARDSVRRTIATEPYASVYVDSLYPCRDCAARVTRNKEVIRMLDNRPFLKGLFAGIAFFGGYLLLAHLIGAR